MAQIVKELGKGGQSYAERELEWCRDTIRKGIKELKTGITCCDNFQGRGRHKSEKNLPSLLEDLTQIVDSQSQTDPSFKSQRLYRRLTVKEVRKQLIEKKGYTDKQLPSEETIRVKLNQLGYYPSRVAKSKPQKKIPETNDIFEHLKQVNQQAEHDPTLLRISMDAKASVKVGPFSRKGKSRVKTQASDHDFNPKATVTPQGFFLPELNELFLYLNSEERNRQIGTAFVTQDFGSELRSNNKAVPICQNFLVSSKMTADFIVDSLEDCWKNHLSVRFQEVKTLLLNQDNGPENNSHRRQFMKRLVEFVQTYQINIRLAYYPPYHSKYNRVERTWAALEHHWNGSLLDTIQTVVNFAQTLTWKGKHPIVKLVEKTYQKGITLTTKEMKHVESKIHRSEQLSRWFVDIYYDAAS
jgi:hypothetical protein